MATKLKNLKITKVDFVDEGANPDADILLFKRKDGLPEPAEDEAVDRDTRSFRKRLMDAFRATFASMEPEDGGQIEKSATTFSEEYRLRSLDKIVDEMWNLCYALNNSLCSIICDEDMDTAQKQSAMMDSVNAFDATIGQAIETWMTGEPYGIVAKDHTGDELSKRLVKVMTATRDRLSEIIEKSSAGFAEDALKYTIPKGEATDMKFDKSRMTPAERAMLEQFEKAYGVEEGPASATEGQAAAPSVGEVIEATMKSAFAAATRQEQDHVPAAVPAPAPAADDSGDLYKGMSPEMKAEFEALKKFREDTEDAALHTIAKSYELIGKKDEDLFPVLKSLKQSSQIAYEQMIAALDSAKAAVEKSGIFEEIGKSGTGGSRQGGAVKEAEGKAAELMKSRHDLTWAQAIDEVLQADADLAKRYEEED